MIKKSTLAVALAAAFACPAWALTPFVVKDIRVEGLQRTEPGTVFNYLPVKVGDTFDDEKSSDALKALFATGFFKDVRLEVDGDVLLVQVVERPAISQITINGSKDLSEEQIKTSLKSAGFSESRIFDQALLDQAIQELKRAYYNRGKYGVQINATITPVERNRVAVRIDIGEGLAAKIKQIKIVGNHQISEADLIDEMNLQTSGWMTWLSKNDQYSKEKLAADIEAIKTYYANLGFLEFTVDSTQVMLDSNREDVYITVNVTEGKPYKVSSIKLAGELKVPEAELAALISVKPGDLFQRQKFTDSVKRIADRLGKDGYAFANVNPVPEIDRDKQTVAFTMFVDPGSRVYVRRINVVGNTQTKDEVIRREFRQPEASWYNGDEIATSRDRVDQLGHFTEVAVDNTPVPGTADQVDLDVKVTEKSTNTLSFGVGYGQSEGVILKGSVTQSNIFGTGNYLSLGFDTSKSKRTISFSFNNPYFTPDGVSLGYDVYRTNFDSGAIDTGDYKTKAFGFGAKLGYPISKDTRINLGLGFDNTKITADAVNGSPAALAFIASHGSSVNSVLASVGLVSDTRNSAVAPTDGVLSDLNFDFALPVDNVKYWRATYQYQKFLPLSRDYTLMFNTNLGYGRGYGNSELPFYKNFYAGGLGSVRGFVDSSIGDKDSFGQALGGRAMASATAELFFPFPGMKHDRTLRLSAFADIGNVYQNSGGNRFFGDMRVSVGVGLSWLSPIGAVKFSIAKPIRSKTGDKKQSFQFQLGTTF